MQPGNDDAASALRPTTTKRVLQLVFVVLFIQMQAILLLSLYWARPSFVAEMKLPQFDFTDFFRGSADWLAGVNPYLRARFVTPPPSLLVAAGLERLGMARASVVFFICNLAVIAASLRGIVRHFELSRQEGALLFGIASMYFPILFVLNRGNLDGLMLGLILIAMFSRHAAVRAFALASSVTLKVYSVLLFAALARERKWKEIALPVGFMVLLLLPFHSLVGPFLHQQAARTTILYGFEDLSPALLFTLFLGKGLLLKAVYGGVWLASFCAAGWRFRNCPLTVRMVYCLPWMLAMPIQVFPYTGVLLLPVLALRAREIALRGRFAQEDGVFLWGFLLVGFQQTAFAGFIPHSPVRVIFFLCNAVGTALAMGGLALGGEKPVWEVAPEVVAEEVCLEAGAVA